MTPSITSRVLVFTVVAACTVMLLPDVAFSRGGGGSRSSGSTSRKTSRSGPAASGSTKKSRARASDNSSKKSKTSKAKATSKKRETKPAGGTQAKRQARWHRRRGGRRIAVADWGDLNCTKSLTVEGTTYHYCDGTWWEKVMDGSEVYWVEVEKPE